MVAIIFHPAVILIAIGLSAIGVAAWLFQRRRSIRSSWYSTEGLVIGTVDKDKEGFSSIVVSWQGPLGDTRQWINPQATSFAADQVGQTVPLLVEEHGHGRVHLPKAIDPFLFFLAGTAMWGVGMVMAGTVIGTNATLG